ncbi:MAG: hypothetical protein LAO20_21425 [Acidobacteriia bacterium]|nr:hypothetical protein [Terriglobia bacterium]
MPAQPQSAYQQAARLKWPTAHISGDGPYALACPVTDCVHLYSFWMAAMNDLTRNHSNWQCRDDHKLVELKPAPQPAPITLRNRALMERD